MGALGSCGKGSRGPPPVGLAPALAAELGSSGPLLSASPELCRALGAGFSLPGLAKKKVHFSFLSGLAKTSTKKVPAFIITTQRSAHNGQQKGSCCLNSLKTLSVREVRERGLGILGGGFLVGRPQMDSKTKPHFGIFDPSWRGSLKRDPPEGLPDPACPKKGALGAFLNVATPWSVAARGSPMNGHLNKKNLHASVGKGFTPCVPSEQLTVPHKAWNAHPLVEETR